MKRKYWLDLFTGKTWEEFLRNGASVSGFKKGREKTANKVRPGDYLLCYITDISRFVAVLEVKSECYVDNAPIWEDENFPIRFKVKLICKLDVKSAIPVLNLKDELSIFKNLNPPKAWSGFFRGSPREFNLKDGKIILQAIREALKHPIVREYDKKKYWRRPKVYKSKLGVVTVPDTEKEGAGRVKSQHIIASHEEIQWLLLKTGSDLGLNVWVARNDRGKNYKGMVFKDIPNLRNELPRQFDEATNRTIELIDVLWLQGNTIMAAFEIEHTSPIFSGLLRLSDLISMQPNIKINLYLIAPDSRREKVFKEINRPTFARLKPPLPKICKFISYSKLKKEIEQIADRLKYVKAEFIKEIAESCKPSGE